MMSNIEWEEDDRLSYHNDYVSECGDDYDVEDEDDDEDIGREIDRMWGRS